jgi:hypothetical protein
MHLLLDFNRLGSCEWRWKLASAWWCPAVFDNWSRKLCAMVLSVNFVDHVSVDIFEIYFNKSYFQQLLSELHFLLLASDFSSNILLGMVEPWLGVSLPIVQ